MDEVRSSVKAKISHLNLFILNLVQDLCRLVFSGSVSEQLREAEGVNGPVGEQLDQDTSG